MSEKESNENKENQGIKGNNDQIPVFRIKSSNSESAVVKYVGFYTKNEKLLDELVEFDLHENPYVNSNYDKDTIYLGNILGYEVTARMYKCNLTGGFLLDNIEYPLYYISVNYSKAIVRGFLMEYYFTFTMTNEDKARLRTPPSYVNAFINGVYKYGISINERITNGYSTMLTELYKKRGETNDTAEKIEKCGKMFERTEHTKTPTLKNIKKHFLEMCGNPLFIDIIYIGLKDREKERREDAGIVDDDEDFSENNYGTRDQSKIINIDNLEETKKRFADLLNL